MPHIIINSSTLRVYFTVDIIWPQAHCNSGISMTTVRGKRSSVLMKEVETKTINLTMRKPSNRLCVWQIEQCGNINKFICITACLDM